uniref:Uncharacterized protein n=1 Tax=Rhizophagus irregularis (strain DAOM 181602 / DAOM 197198 / MUCL 43194) TaxID=747089 RepID=U9UZ27_RHIID
MDFVMTIEDDNEVISLEEENSDINDDTQINNTKAKKTNKKDKKANKKENKKLNNEKNNEKNKRDDKNNINSENDIINPEFTFFIDGINNKPIEHPWDFNAARAGLKPKIPVR